MSETLVMIGSIAFVVLGVGHTLAELLMSSPDKLPEAAAATVTAMKETRIAMPGRRVSLFMMMRGFSLMMGVLLVGFGTLDLLLPAEVALSMPVLVVNTGVAGLGFALASRYFFAVPIVGTLVSLVCFTGALVLAM